MLQGALLSLSEPQTAAGLHCRLPKQELPCWEAGAAVTMKMDPGENSHGPGSAPPGQEAALPSDAHGLRQWGISAPALLLGTTVGTSSHGTSALFANLLTVPPGPQVPIHWVVNMLPSN